MADVIKGMPDLHADGGESTAKPADEGKPGETLAGATTEKPADRVDPAAATDGPDDDKPDAETTKRLATVAKAEKRAREQSDQRKVELDRREAALLQRENEVTGKATTLEDIKALIRSKPLDALAKLGIENEDDLEVVAKHAYANSKSGKADPRNKAYAEQTAKERETATGIEALRAELAEVKQQLTAKEQRASAETFAQRYADEAVKAIPKEPTLIGNLHATDPNEARAALLSLGAQMEREAMEADGATKYDPSYTPSHSDVIAEYEKRQRSALKKLGIDADTVLKVAPAGAVVTAAPAAKKPASTLDPTGGGPARPATKLSQDQTRAEAIKNLPWTEV